MIEHNFTLIALLFPRESAPPINASSLCSKMPDETVAYPPRKQVIWSLNTNPSRLMLCWDAYLEIALNISMRSNESKLMLSSVKT